MHILSVIFSFDFSTISLLSDEFNKHLSTNKLLLLQIKLIFDFILSVFIFIFDFAKIALNFSEKTKLLLEITEDFLTFIANIF